MKTPTLLLTATVAALLAAGGVATAQVSGTRESSGTVGHRDGALARDFGAVTRDTVWRRTGALRLDFPTFPTEGIAFTRDHVFLSAVEILEPPVKYPAPRDG